MRIRVDHDGNGNVVEYYGHSVEIEAPFSAKRDDFAVLDLEIGHGTLKITEAKREGN